MMAYRQWADDLTRKFDEANQHPSYWERVSSCWIARVPDILRKDHDKEFTPQILSIGPFHRREGGEDLFTIHKLKYTEAAGRIIANIDRFEDYMMAVGELEGDLREYYSEPESLPQDRYQFVEMMVVDGCFIIVLFLKAYGIFSRENDPIFRLNLLPTLKEDLLRLENQIPYPVLECLFDLIIGDLKLCLYQNQIPNHVCFQRLFQPNHGMVTLDFLAINFFRDSLPIKTRTMDPNTTVGHLLHLLHSNLFLEAQTEGFRVDSEPPITIRCVADLLVYGIKFRKGDERIRFTKDVLAIPPLRIENITNSVFLNLIAFEKQDRGIHVQAYTTIMYFLIRSANDVKFLSQNAIIDDCLCNDEEVVHLFQNLGRESWSITKCEKFYPSDVLNRVDSYCKTWRGWIASFMIKYFNNPWAIIFTLLPAMMILLQTLFPMLSYFNHSS